MKIGNWSPPQLPKDAKSIIDFVWRHYVDKGKWPTTRHVYAQWDKAKVSSAFSSVGDGYLTESEDSSGNTFQLTTAGILTSSEGEQLFALFTRFCRVLLDEYYRDPNKNSLQSQDVQKALKISDEETAMIGRLAFGGLLGAGGSHGDRFVTWESGIPIKELENFPRESDATNVATHLAGRFLGLSRKTFLTPNAGSPQNSSAKRNSPITIGMTIRLKHVTSGISLKSLRKAFTHVGSSKQQMVVGSKEGDFSTVWKIKAAHGDETSEDGTHIQRGTAIRFEHKSTQTNLHSHSSHPAPISVGQQEVTAFGSYGRGDVNDDWIVLPEQGDFWLAGEPIRLCHKGTNHNLHSHGASHPDFTAGYQEVTAFPGRDDNDLWTAIVVRTSAEPNAALLGPASGEDLRDFSAAPAAYSPDYCAVGGTSAVPDYLGIDGLAVRVAELLALRETRLPLALGLFGNWGSGKSHFMNLVDRHLKRLAKEPRETWARRMGYPANTAGDGPWCQHIVPIYFNAWHYLDANLWASLVTEIFDALFARLNDKPDQVELIRNKLKEAGGATARAEEEVVAARKAVDRATETLGDARERAEKEQTLLNGLIEGFRSLVPQLTTSENRKRVIDALGVDIEKATVAQLNDARHEAGSLLGSVRVLWKRCISPDGMWWRIAWAIGTGGGVWLIAKFSAEYIPRLRAMLDGFGAARKIAIDLVAAAIGYALPAIRYLRKLIRDLDDWCTKAEEAQSNRRNSPDVATAQTKVNSANADVHAAEQRLSDAKTHYASLKAELDELRPDKRLRRFIEARAASADYRGQLGVVSLVRRDFKELSEIFAASPAQGHAGGATPLDALSKSIDRIVLFVDDLDRCQPDKVVEVLQAVHLLLAFPLFAVVVGVDQRCLEHSLKKQFPGLLVSPPLQSGDGSADAQNHPAAVASPLDYLEKIFHIPLQLPAIDRRGFHEMLNQLTQTGAQIAASPPQSTSVEPGTPEQLQGAEIREESVAPQTEQGDEGAIVGTSQLAGAETAALKDFHALIRTPRATNRLLNTYRLVRAGVLETDWPQFRGNDTFNGECRVAMLLLAAAAGYPSMARKWFATLRESDPTALIIGDDDRHADPGYAAFAKATKETFGTMPSVPSQETVNLWIERVEQFAF